MNFASDNRGPAHPAIISALAAANTGHAPSYGEDPLTLAVRNRLRRVFEAPEAEVFLTATGTATNALILATLARPWDEIYCAADSHIRHDECNAVEFYSGGARITHIGDNDRLDPGALAQVLAGAAPHGHHNAQPGPVSLVQVTDLGGVYTIPEIDAVTDIAKAWGLPVHMDGARFANALVALGCSPAEMTWKAGVDAVSFGGTKNGCLGVEAAIFFDPAHAQEFALRRKRAGHLLSKGRFLAAQMSAYLDGDLWLDLAARANAAGQRLFSGLAAAGARFQARADANLAFVWLPRGVHARALAAGAVYEVMGDTAKGPGDEELLSRFVCDWSTTPEEVDAFLGVIGDG